MCSSDLVVFQRNNITDQSSDLAVIQEMASSSALMSAGKLVESIEVMPRHAGMQRDARQAYTQSRLGGHETWVFLPRDELLPEWPKYRQPVVRLDLALYGHPLSGVFGEQRCAAQLKNIGFIPMQGWESCYIHLEWMMVLSVYVDDFKIAGKASNMDRAWKAIRSVITTDDPTPFGKYLGCEHGISSVDDSCLQSEIVQQCLNSKSENLEMLKNKTVADGDVKRSKGDKIPAVR